MTAVVFERTGGEGAELEVALGTAPCVIAGAGSHHMAGDTELRQINGCTRRPRAERKTEMDTNTLLLLVFVLGSALAMIWLPTFASPAYRRYIGMGTKLQGCRHARAARSIGGETTAVDGSDTIPSVWCVLRWKDGSGLLPDYTVGPDSPHRPIGTLVRRFEPEQLAQDGNGKILYESPIEVLYRAQAFAEALNHKGAARERALRSVEEGG